MRLLERLVQKCTAGATYLSALSNAEIDAQLAPQASGVHVKSSDRVGVGEIPIGARVRLDYCPPNVGTVEKVSPGGDLPLLVRWDVTDEDGEHIYELCCIHELEVLSVPDDHSLPTLRDDLNAAMNGQSADAHLEQYSELSDPHIRQEGR